MKNIAWLLLMVFVLTGCVTNDSWQKMDQDLNNWWQDAWKQKPAVPADSGTEPSTPDEPSDVPVVAKGNRRLSIQVNLPEDNNFVNAFAKAREAGLQDVVLSLDWPILETGKEVYNPDPNWLAIANSYYPANKVPLHLMIRPVHTNQLAVPKDLAGRAFDDPVVIARFNKLMDWVLDQVKDADLISLSIGSELDISFRGNAKAWAQYETFFRETAAHARLKRPGLQVTAEMTYPVFSGPDKARAISLNRHADMIGVSYYLTDPDFKAMDPKTVHQDFAALTALFDKPLLFYQFGYPSGSKCVSNEAKQAAFVRESFRAWDKYPKQIRMLNFTWMYEISPAAVQGYTEYYHFDNPAFRDFLGSIGLRSWKGSGTDKLAWKALKEESKLRGW